jgi:predicted DNA-binding transcriptional regulator AlpA
MRNAKLISIKEAAERAGLSIATYYRRSAEGVLPKGVKIGHLRRIDPVKLYEALESLEQS